MVWNFKADSHFAKPLTSLLPSLELFFSVVLFCFKKERGAGNPPRRTFDQYKWTIPAAASHKDKSFLGERTPLSKLHQTEALLPLYWVINFKTRWNMRREASWHTATALLKTVILNAHTRCQDALASNQNLFYRSQFAWLELSCISVVFAKAQ